MARNVFSLNPVEYEIERQEAARQGRGVLEQPKAVETPKAPKLTSEGTPDFGAMAVEHQVPRNLIIAMTDAAGIQDPAQASLFANEAASRIGREMATGKDAESALKAILGENAPVGELIKAAKAVPEYDLIGAEKNEADTGGGSLVGDMSKQFAGGVVKGTGQAIEGVVRGTDRSSGYDGRMVDEDGDGVPELQLEKSNEVSPVVAAGQEIGDVVRDWGASIQAGVSEETKKAIKDFAPDGELFKPSTWDFGENPSVRGVTMVTMDVLGSLAPVVISSVLTRSPATGAVVGGAQGGGAGAEGARDVVMQAAQEMVEGPNGEQISRLEAESPYYRSLIADGESPEVAAIKTAEAASQLAFMYTAPIGTVGGALTGRIVTKGVGALAGQNVGVRVAGAAALSGVEEASQEVAEGVATLKGAEDATGLELNEWEGSFGNAVLGALGGGPVGAGAGLRGGGRDEAEEVPPAQAAPVQGPEPLGEMQGPPAPAPEPTGPIGRAQREAGSGLAPGDVINVDGLPVEVVSDTGAGLRVRDPEGEFFIPRADLDSGAVTVETPQPSQPTGMFPDMRPGNQVTISDVDGRQYDAVFIGEDQNGVQVRIGGEVITMTPQEFDRARGAMPELEPQTTLDTQPGPDAAAQAPQSDLDQAGQAIRDILNGQQAEPVTPQPDVSVQGDPDAAGQSPQTSGVKPGEAIEGDPAPETPEQDVEDVSDLDVGSLLDDALNNLEAEENADALADEPVDTAWDKMSAETRTGLLLSVGFDNGRGGLTGPGKRLLTRSWADMSPRVQGKLMERQGPPEMQGPAPLGAIQGPAPLGEMQGPQPLGERQGPEPLGEMQGPEPLGEMQGPEPLGEMQGPPAPQQGATPTNETTSDADADTVTDTLDGEEDGPAVPSTDTSELAEGDRVSVYADGKWRAGTFIQETETLSDDGRPIYEVWIDSSNNATAFVTRDRIVKGNPQPNQTAETDGEAAPEPQTLGDKVRAAIKAGSVTHITKKGKTLRGHILKDVKERSEAQKVDKYTFRKDGGWFIRQKDAADYVGELVEKRGFDHPDVIAAVQRIGQKFSPPGWDLSRSRYPDLTLTTLPEPEVMDVLNALASPDEWKTPAGMKTIKELRFNELEDAQAYVKTLREFDGIIGETGERQGPEPLGEMQGPEPLGEFQGPMPEGYGKKNTEKAEDFGEKIGGMRKDSARKYVEDLGQEIDPEGMSLSEAFPMPDYPALIDNGLAPEIAALVGIIRDNIDRKPTGDRAYYAMRDWSDQVTRSRELAQRLLADPDFEQGNITDIKAAIKRAYEIVNGANYYDVKFGNTEAVKALVIGALPPSLIGAATTKFDIGISLNALNGGDWSSEERDGTYELKRRVPGNRYRFVAGSKAFETKRKEDWSERPLPSELGVSRYTGDNKDAAETQNFAELAASEITAFLQAEADARKGRSNSEGPLPLEAASYRRGGGVIILTKPRKIPVMSGFSTELAAKTYLNENREEIEKLARLLRDGPEERREENRDRQGPEWRPGDRDATKKDFLETLGFRGVAFGNGLTKKERQENMNATYDAMMDLAGVLGLAPEALSLNGRLGIGFGTHGKGGRGHWAAAFIQSSDKATDQVIAMTRNQGPGSLAHEWWHAVDNYLARKDAEDSDVSAAFTGKKADNRNEFMSDRKRRRGALDEDTYEAFQNLRNTLIKSDWAKRMRTFDGFKSEPYWAAPIELSARAFERKVVDALYQRDMVNDYLVNINEGSGAYPPSREARAAGIDAAYDGALQEIEKVLRIKSKDAPKLPDVFPDRVPQDPGVGTQWESLDGWQEVTGFNATTEQFTVKALDGGEERQIPYAELERVIAEEEAENTPAGRAARDAKAKQEEANRKAKEKADENKKKANERRAKFAEIFGNARDWEKKASALITQYANETGKNEGTLTQRLGKMYNFQYPGNPDAGYSTQRMVLTRGAHIIQQIEVLDAKIEGEYLQPAKGAVDTSGTWIKNYTKMGQDFIRWYQEKWAQQKEQERLAAEYDAQQEAEAEPEAEQAPEEDVSDLDVSSLLDNALNELEAEESADAAGEAVDPEEQRITNGFLEDFRNGTRFPTIVRARKRAGEILGRDIDVSDYTMMEDAIEAAIVMRAREIASGDGDSVAKYADLLDLYDAQPILSERTPEKMRNQAYSTPAPLAYVASRLAGIGPNTRVVEPSAGNGMLLMEADPRNVQANELQEHRAKQLERIYPGAVSQGDAMEMSAAPFDVLIANPPFGKVKAEDGKTTKQWELGNTGVKTKEIDHAMAYRYLEQMPDDGRAVLIVGSVKKTGDRQRNYQERSKLSFYKTLYENYNVVDHFTANGDLYKRQGAAWPVDVIVIDGRAASALDAPYRKAPDVLMTWAEIGRKLNDAPDVDTAERGPDSSIGADGEGSRPDTGGLSGPSAQTSGADGATSDTGGRGSSGGVSGQSGGRSGGNAGPDGDAVGGNVERPTRTDPAGEVSGETGPDQATAPAGSDTDGVSGQSGGSGQVGPRTAGEAFQSGKDNSADALKAAGDAIKAILNTKIDPNTTSSMGAGFVQDMYDNLKPHLSKAWDAATEAAKDFSEAISLFVRAIRERMGLKAAEQRELKPYLDVFLKEAQAAWGRPKQDRAPARKNNEAETDFQVAYQPRSAARFQVQSLVPRAMAQAAQAALDKIEAKHGNIDEYVAKELGYNLDEMLGTPEKPGYFSAEQVDALAMAITNVNDGKGFIIGDQTGIGKGRFVAAMLRHAERKGKIPVFVTEKPGLYADMVRDMRDIGMADAQDGIFPTNINLGGDIPISGPGDLFTNKTPKQRDALFKALRKGKLPKDARFVFTTYSQMQTVRGRWPERAEALLAAAPNAMIIMDESHNAGGTEGGRQDVRQPGDPAPNRAEFFRDLVDTANGTVFSSATYAKNPTVMSLYRSTNLSLALPEGTPMDNLGPAITKGGVPLQQVIANAIAGDGQYIRREKSLKDIDFTSTHELGDDNPIKVDRDLAVNISEVMGEIAEFDAEVMAGVRESFIATIANEGLLGSANRYVGPENIEKVSDNPFASSFHNLVNQILLAIKVDAVADMAIEKAKQGEKPIIGLMNVNSSIIDEYLADEGISEDGAEVTLNFTTVVDRYLNRLRRIKITESDDTSWYYTMTDADMGQAAVAELARIRDLIYSLPIDKMSGSPVDAILDRMRAAGLKVDEITGRSIAIRDGIRTSRSSSQGDNKRRMNEFNSGELDALVISSSGATGFSMHATDAPNNDGKKRHMIIAQPHADINVFMQMLGRVNRTGQTVLPEYTLAVSNLSLERRVAAVLMKKMASLNANTTAAKRGATSLGEDVDFINEVGDFVVRRYLKENPDLALRVGLVESDDPNSNKKIEDIAKKLTGRFAFLHPDEVDRHYEAIGRNFSEYMAQLELEGRNPLEAKVMDLQAKTLFSEVLSSGRGTDSLLDADLTLERIDAKRPGAPYKVSEVERLISDQLGEKGEAEWLKAAQDAIEAKVPDYQETLKEEEKTREKAVVSAKEAVKLAEEALPRIEKRFEDAEAEFEAIRDSDDKDAVREAKKKLTAAEKGRNQQRRHVQKTKKDVEKAEALVENVRDRMKRQRQSVDAIKTALEGVVPGAVFQITTPNFNAPGVVIETNIEGQGSNPTAAGQIKVKFAVADNARTATYTLNQIMNQQTDMALQPALPGVDWKVMFKASASMSREERWMATGNLIAGVDRFKETTGQVVIYTTEDGQQKTGLLMPRTFNPQKSLENEDVSFPDTESAARFLREVDAVLKTADKNVSFHQDGYNFRLRVNKARGRAFFLLRAVQPYINNFREAGKSYTGKIDRENLKTVLDIYKDNLGVSYIADNYRDEARRIAGIEIPDFEAGTGGDLKAKVRDGEPSSQAKGKALLNSLRDELKKVGIDGRISLHVAAGFNHKGQTLDGYFLDGVIGVGTKSPDGAMGVLRHEIVHALRNKELWGKDFGLFTRDEWQTLVRAARADKAMMADIQRLYPSLNTSAQYEEAIAEMFRQYANDRDAVQASPVRAALDKMRKAIEAIVRALRGSNAMRAADVFESILSGEIGGRGPDGPGGGRTAAPQAKVSNLVRTDNPGGSWLEGKRKYAEEAMRSYEGASGKGFVGSITAHTRMPVMLPVRMLQSIPGAMNEQRRPGDMRYDELMQRVEATGWDDRQDGNAIVVAVNHKGQSYIMEGNTRLAIAKDLGIENIRAEVKWWNGGEEAAGRITPERVTQAAIGDPTEELKARVRDMASTRGVPIVPASQMRRNASELFSDFVTDAMGGGKLGKYNILSLVPGRPLFEELAKNLPSSKVYLKLKERMDALRQEWHTKTDEIAREWQSEAAKDTKANGDMMDLMHDSTLAGVDPSKPFTNEGFDEEYRADREETYRILKARFDELPASLRRIFKKARLTYDALADQFEEAVVENIQNAALIAAKRADRAYEKEMRRIEDEGLEGPEREDAIDEATAKRDAAQSRAGWASKARAAELRLQFESNRLKGPYFPLARFGKYFMAVRDENGKVVSFSRFESAREQRREVKRAENEGMTVEYGVLGSNDADLRGMVDPNFVAEVEGIMANLDVDPAAMDAVWQRWLETLPDSSIRKNRIHRKGRAGFNPDALRAFTHHVFHGAHQLSRLKYGLQMEEAINDAYDEAAKSSDPNRETLIVDEMKHRHQWTMAPKADGWATGLTSLGFIWYLGATPGAAIVNVSQTTVMGVPIMKAAFRNVSLGQITRQIARASRDFISGGFDARGSDRLTDVERAALNEAYKRGIIDKTQAHDLASVAESGVEYNPTREKIMRSVSYMFHKAEVFNREVTFLAAYRIALSQGIDPQEAIEKAGSLTWKIHFDYQSSSRARFMQDSVPRVIFLFRQHTVNVMYRIFRDAHQMLNGASQEERAEAKAQLVGVMLSMMAHAGITGTFGYGLVTALLGMFLPGDDDDIDEWLHDALLLEGQSMPAAAWNYAMGMALKGIPGHVAGVDLTERIGMPNIWFRGPNYDMSTEDTYTHYFLEIAGPVAGIGATVARGAGLLAEGEIWRGLEAATPKFINDMMQGVRYGTQGVLDKNGDPIMEDVSVYQAIVQAIGFTPAELSERYDDNTRMRGLEREVKDERRKIMREVGDVLLDGKSLTPELRTKIREFNREYPTYPITKNGIKQSLRNRKRWSDGKIDGVNIDEKLRPQIEDQMAPRLY